MSAQARAIQSDADHAEWLKQSLARLPEAKFQITGLSIGGCTAANLALHAPLHVASATLIDPVSVVDGIPQGPIVRPFLASLQFLLCARRESFNS